MNVSQLLEVLAGRWRLIALITLGFTLAMFALCLALPKKYTASAQILVDGRHSDAMSDNAADRSPQMNQTLMATQAAIIASDRVARRVVARLKLDQSPAAREQWEEETEGRGDVTSFIAAGMLKRLTVVPGRDSNVLTLSYPNRDPRFAMDVVNAFAQVSLETNLELKVEPARQFSAWFDARTQVLRKQLEDAHRRLTEYQREKGIAGGTGGQIDIENAKLAQLASQLVAVQASQQDSSSRQEQARGNAVTSPDVLNNSVIAGLRTNVAAGEAQLKLLGAQYGEKHPSVIAARENLAELKTQLDTEMRAVARTVTTTNTVNEKRVAEARAALETQRARVYALANGANDLVVLQSGVESAQRALDAATTRQAQTSMESQVQQTNVFLLAPATEPFMPSSPKVALFTACAAALGLLVGLGAALWRESRQPLIRSVEDLGIVVDLPVIAALPHAALKQVKQRVGGRWPRLGFARA